MQCSYCYSVNIKQMKTKVVSVLHKEQGYNCLHCGCEWRAIIIIDRIKHKGG